MRRPLCLAVLAAGSLALSGCLIVVDHENETHWVHDDSGRARHVGVYLESVDSTTASQLSLEAGHATVVERIVEGSPADQAGLRPHDIITAVDGDSDASPSRVREAIRGHRPGDSISFSILRQGKPQVVAVTMK